MKKNIDIWKPIEFNEKWKNTNTSELDNLLPSWWQRKKVLTPKSREYSVFLERLKRRHAIETGIIENLYDLDRGVTETLIQKGFDEILVERNDTNISTSKLMDHLSDQSKAIDFIFDIVKEERPLTKNIIKQLHQLVTQSQEYVDALDPQGKTIQVKLCKGEFKEHENNPQRKDGKKYVYCPPLQVDSEMDKLIKIYCELENENIYHHVIISAWFHHAFSIIHPFQDGNGRVARLLSSLILIKKELFPFTVNRDERKQYLDALECADNGDPNDLVSFFSKNQKHNIEKALNLEQKTPKTSISEMGRLLSQKATSWKKSLEDTKKKQINHNRKEIFDYCHEIVEKVYNELKKTTSKEIDIFFEECVPNGSDEKDYYFVKDIIQYARKHEYFVNRNLPKGWFKLSIALCQDRKQIIREYQIIISIHHYGYGDNTMAVSTFLRTTEKEENNNKGITEPLEVEPYTISLEDNKTIDKNKRKENFQHFVQETLTIGLAQIMDDIPSM